MIWLIVRRLIWLLTVLVAVSSITFGIIHLSGDPTDGFVDPAATPEVRAQIRDRLGLDDPVLDQYRQFLSNAIRGDFGTSWRADQSARMLVISRLDSTIILAASALFLATSIGLLLGALHTKTSNRLVRTTLDWLISLGQALPAFWVGSMLVLVFAVNLEWLPSSGGGGLKALILPAITLALQPMAVIARLTSTQLTDTLRSDFVRTARGKGLSEQAVFLHHALRSSFGPILAFIGVQIGFLIGGAVIVEGVFAYPGIGSLALNAVRDRDLPVIQCFVITVAIIIVVTTNAIDLIARLLDPRIRLESQT